MGDMPGIRAGRLLDRMGRIGLREAALTEVRAELKGRDHIEHLADRAVLGVAGRWRAIAATLDPASTLRAPMLAAADELTALLAEPADRVCG